MATLLLDLRFALRSLRRRPTFAAVAVATIALSIGAATSLFSIVDAVLFRPLPYRDPGQLVSVWQTDTNWKKQPIVAAMWDRMPIDYTDFLTWRARQRSFSGVAVWANRTMTLDGADGPEQRPGVRASAGLFELLGVRPLLGRTFLPGEDTPGGPRVAILGFDTWTVRYGRRQDVIGSLVRVDTTAYQIVGVLPAGFTIERGKPPAALWVPAGQDRGDVGQSNRSFHGIARLKPGVPRDRAALETKWLLDGSADGVRGVRITDLVRDETREVRAPLLILLGAAGLLLLIGCANIATLLLGEAATRDMEMAARVALGASRGRLVRQLLTESVLLAAVGSALGALLALWGTRAIVALAPDGVPGIQSAHVDLRVLTVMLAAASVTGVLFGLAPALTLSGVAPAAVLRAGHTAGGSGRLQRAMISTELALSVVLLVGAGLFSRSLQRLTAVDPGFRADHLLTVRFGMRRGDDADTARLHALYDELLERTASLPGVSAATAVSILPFSGTSSSSTYRLEGESDAQPGVRGHAAIQRTVAPNYFSTLGIPLLAGRAFSGEDRGGSPLVVILSEAAARRDFPTESPVGKRVRFADRWRTVVGIVADIKFKQLSVADQPTIYTPFAQRMDEMALIVRTRPEPISLARALRSTVRAVAPNVAVTSLDTMDALIWRSTSEERFRTVLVALFGGMAAVLAAVGVYGVTARSVSRRTREVGIRVALGATTSAIIRMIVRQTLSGVMIGVIIGSALSLLASRLITVYLFGVSAHDPSTYAAICTLLIVVSVAASWLPARLAGRVEPAIVLRGE